MNTHSPGGEQSSWRALRFFNLYRVVVSGLLSLLSLLGALPPNAADFDIRLFSISACSYLVLAIGAQVFIERRSLAIRHNVYGLILVDVAVITLLLHASGGVASGFGMLLVVSIAGVCLLASTRAAVSFASLASLAVLAETIFGTFYLNYPLAMYTQAGLLGAAFFGTAILASLMAERARRSEELAARRAVDIESLSELNEHIVQRMRAGILVLDALNRVVLINRAASAMLTADPHCIGLRLQDVSPVLAEACDAWLQEYENRKTPVTTEAQGIDVVVSFTRLGPTEEGGTLVFLEDAAEIRQQAQQLKLVSLGRLTASIAHEIRNPLAAISHAGQLLSESVGLSPQDKRLTRIIDVHSGRVNDIIENVMTIGRREKVISESFPLKPWLDKFVDELVERRRLQAADVLCNWPDDDVVVRADKSQLHQILWNLCENALRYSTRTPLLTFDCDVNRSTRRPVLDVTDTGPGMPDHIAEQVFEPFFTAGTSGTGLGLFIARELCETNQAALVLAEHGSNGCRFRIHFAHPGRQQLSSAQWQTTAH